MQCESTVGSSQPLPPCSSDAAYQGEISGGRCAENARLDVRFLSCRTVDDANAMLLNCLLV